MVVQCGRPKAAATTGTRKRRRKSGASDIAPAGKGKLGSLDFDFEEEGMSLGGWLKRANPSNSEHGSGFT